MNNEKNNNISKETGLNYNGNVNLKLKIKDKIVNIKKHNSGTNYLFKFIYKFLTGNYSKSDIPSYLDLVSDTSEDFSDFSSCLNSDIRLTSANYNENRASFNGVIRYDDLLAPGSFSPDNYYRLYIYSGYDNINMKYPIAYIPVSAEDLNRIVPGVSLIVEWIMSISNKE